MGALHTIKTPEQSCRPTKSQDLVGVTQNKPEGHCHGHTKTKTPLSPAEEGAVPPHPLQKAEETQLTGRGEETTLEHRRLFAKGAALTRTAMGKEGLEVKRGGWKFPEGCSSSASFTTMCPGPEIE